MTLRKAFPHVETDEGDFGSDLVADDMNDSLEGVDGSFLTDPQ